MIVVFTCGCFDIFHRGHLHLLTTAKSYGDKLIVGLNSDSSVQKLKGVKRPIFNQEFRKSHLEALECVDKVVIFDEPTPMRLLRQFTPDVFAKGSEYSNPVGFDFVRSYGGSVLIVDTMDSTTRIIKEIRNR